MLFNGRFNEDLTECTDWDVENGFCYGGASRLMTAVENIRKTDDHVLLLDAGDQYQGTLWHVVHRHRPIVDMMNLLRYDAMSLGNHEFDHGIAGLEPFVNGVNFPVLAANVKLGKSALNLRIQNWIRFKIANISVGIIGFITPETATLSSPGPDVVFEDIIPSLKIQIQRMRQEGVDFIIALGHAGIEMDRLICQTVPGVDVVVGGHSNTFLYTGPVPSVENAVGPYPEVYGDDRRHCLVVTSYAFGKYLGSLRLQLDELKNGSIMKWAGNPILLDKRFTENEQMSELLKPYSAMLDVYKKKTIGKTMVELNGMCRISECNVGNLIADAVVEAAIRKSEFDHSNSGLVVIVNGGSIRNFKLTSKSNFTMADLYHMVPFRNDFVHLTINGSQLLDVFEHSVSGYSTTNALGKFLQISGARVLYDLKQPAGKRVRSVLIRCQACTLPRFESLKLNSIYSLMTNTFLAKGGDSYSMLANAKYNNPLSSISDVEAVLGYFKRHSPVTVGLEGRIMFTDDDLYVATCQS
ncbi:Snake venom 5'-nucleotidase [Trichinella papuae]|uniref:Snake venom 5'-nucleotidase n=1 Tax=Trichinella papuae TaxID=268474 RepID=A0A0V1N3J3_9BILA|nr:Snake venom 5'-nucleotidase [Trichinella papuae]